MRTIKVYRTCSKRGCSTQVEAIKLSRKLEASLTEDPYLCFLTPSGRKLVRLVKHQEHRLAIITLVKLIEYFKELVQEGEMSARKSGRIMNLAVRLLNELMLLQA